MGDGRELSIDKKYFPHSIAYVNAWNQTSKIKPGFIPDLSPNNEGIDSMIYQAMKEYSVRSQFPNLKEVDLFGGVPVIWIPEIHIIAHAMRISLIGPSPSGYDILVSQRVFEREFARIQGAEILRKPYLNLVSYIRENMLNEEKVKAA